MGDIEVSGWFKGVEIGATNLGVFRDVELLRINSHSNLRVGIESYGPFPRTGYAHRNIIIRNCSASNNSGDPSFVDNHSGSGIVLSNVDGALIEWSVAHTNGYRQASLGGGPVGIWAWEARHVHITNCAAWGNSNGKGHQDGGGFDFDGGVKDSLIEYSLSFNNTGAGFMVCQFDGASEIKNITVRRCASIGDGYDAGNSGGLEAYSPHDTSNIVFEANTIFAASQGTGRKSTSRLAEALQIIFIETCSPRVAHQL